MLKNPRNVIDPKMMVDTGAKGNDQSSCKISGLNTNIKILNFLITFVKDCKKLKIDPKIVKRIERISKELK